MYARVFLLLLCGAPLLEASAAPARTSFPRAGQAITRPLVDLFDDAAFLEGKEKEATIDLLRRHPHARKGAFEALRKEDSPRHYAAAVIVLGRMGRASKNEVRQLLSPQSTSELQPKLLTGLAMAGAECSWAGPAVLDLAGHGYMTLSKRLAGGRTGNWRLEMRTSQALVTLGLIDAEPSKALALVEKFLALAPTEGGSGSLDELAMACRMSAATTLWQLSADKERALALFDEGLATEKALAVEGAIYGLGEMGPEAASRREHIEPLLEAAGARLQASIREALDKIDGKQPTFATRWGDR